MWKGVLLLKMYICILNALRFIWKISKEKRKNKFKKIMNLYLQPRWSNRDKTLYCLKQWTKKWTKYMKQWFQNTEHQALKESDPWEGSPTTGPAYCFERISSWRNRGGTQAEPRRLPELRCKKVPRDKSGQGSQDQIPERGQLHGERTPEICRVPFENSVEFWWMHASEETTQVWAKYHLKGSNGITLSMGKFTPRRIFIEAPLR